MSPTTVRGLLFTYFKIVSRDKNSFTRRRRLLRTSLPRYGRATFERETDLPISGYRLGLYRLPFLSFPRVTLDFVPRGTFISSSTKDSKLLRQKDTAFG